jgi:hypothetical protein
MGYLVTVAFWIDVENWWGMEGGTWEAGVKVPLEFRFVPPIIADFAEANRWDGINKDLF